MNPIKVFLSIFAFGIALTLVLGIIGYPEQPDQVAQEPEGEAVAIDEFVTKTCAGCHGADLSGGTGPGLVGLNASKEQIMEVLKNGKGIMPGNLAAGREEEVADYLLTLR